MKRITRSEKIRMPLDIAANLYPTANDSDWNNTFSVSIVLTENIRRDVLCICLHEMKKRLPGFFVSLRIGYNRCLFVPSVDDDIISEETGAQLCYIDYHNPAKPIFRIKYKENRITAEVFHALADATGAMMFLRSLAARYIELTKNITIESPLIHSVRDNPSPEEFEDAYKKYLLSDKKRLKKVSSMGGLFACAREEYYCPAGLPSSEYGRIERIIVKTADLKAAAGRYNNTISEFILTACALSLYRLAPRGMNLPQRIAIPAGLRRYYPTPTLRNFSTVTNIIIHRDEAEEPTMASLSRSLGSQLRESAERDSLASSLVRVASISELPIVKALPAAVLQWAIKQGKKTGAACTTCFSNIGVIKLPEEMEPFVERVEFSLSRQGRGGTMFAAAGCKDICTISATVGSNDDSILYAFLQILSDENIPFTRK